MLLALVVYYVFLFLAGQGRAQSTSWTINVWDLKWVGLSLVSAAATFISRFYEMPNTISPFQYAVICDLLSHMGLLHSSFGQPDTSSSDGG